MSGTARNQRAGWEARWGSEEPNRVAGAVAGEIAGAGAAAGFSTAGGLENAPASATPPESLVGAAESAAQLVSDDPLVDDFLPRDVVELQELVRMLLFESCARAQGRLDSVPL